MAKPRRFVRMFKPRFAPAVKDWLKLQTVRLRPKVMPRPGDIIDCREWTGKPYRSKQRKLCEGLITRVEVVEIGTGGAILVGESWLYGEEREAFARDDGFGTCAEMLTWFHEEHGLPFEGIVIYWEPLAKGGANG